MAMKNRKRWAYTVWMTAAVLLCQAFWPSRIQAGADQETISIQSVQDLEKMASDCSLDTWSQGKTFVLEEDLNLEGEDFSPIPTFGGTFEGNGHTISGLKLEGGAAYQGLFRFVQEGGTVRDLNVAGTVISDNSESYIGGIAGSNSGIIANCSFSGKIEGKQTVGGIAGINETAGRILDSSSAGIVLGEEATGGISGKNLGTISGSVNESAVNTIHEETGFSLEESIDEINGTEILDTTTDTGGIAGYSSGILEGCRNTGEIGYAHVGYNVGGIAGRSVGYLNDCVNEGRIMGRKDVGGVTGQMAPNVLLIFSEDTIGQLESEMETLDTLVDQALNHAQSNGDAVSARLEQISNYADAASDSVYDLAQMTVDKADQGIEAINDAADMVGEALDGMEMAAANGESVMEEISDSFDLLEQSMEEVGDALDIGADGISGLAEMVQSVKEAGIQGKEGLAVIKEALASLSDAWKTEDSEAAAQAAAMLEQGMTQLAEAEQKISAAARKLITALPEEGNNEEIRGALEMLAAGLEESSQGLVQLGKGIVLTMANTELDWTVVVEQFKTIASSSQIFAQAREKVVQSVTQLKDALLDLSHTSGGLGDGASGAALAMDALEGAAWDAGQVAKELYDTLWELAERETLELDPIGEEYRDAGDNVHSAVSGIGEQMDLLREELSGTGDTLENDLRNLETQFGRVVDIIIDAFHEIQDGKDQELWEDVSEEEIENTTLGKAKACVNFGEVEGDINTGGIAGAMGIEYALDPEDDIAHIGTESFQFHYETRAILQACTNQGAVSAKKDGSGGIVGRMDLGYVLDCENYGRAESSDGNYVGGIAGRSDSTIRRCWSKCVISGKDYVGGIAGFGLRIYDCTAMVMAENADSFLGAIAGDWDREGALERNRFTGDGLAGVDGISYSGKAEPVSYVSLMETEGVPEPFHHFTVTYVADEKVIREDTCSYGQPVSDHPAPEVPEKEGYYGEWEDIGEDSVTFDHVIEAAYTPYSTTIASSEMRDHVHPVFLAEGIFDGKAVLTAEKTGEAENEELWKVSLENAGEGPYNIRFAPPKGWKTTSLSLVTDEGETELESLEDGSCLVFQAGPSFVLKAENSSLRTAEPAKLAALLAVLTILCGGAAVWLMRRRKTRKSA